jgi:hypothetical protein
MGSRGILAEDWININKWKSKRSQVSPPARVTFFLKKTEHQMNPIVSNETEIKNFSCKKQKTWVHAAAERKDGHGGDLIRTFIILLMLARCW